MTHSFSPAWHIWITDWHFDPYAVLGLLGLLALYYGGASFLRGRNPSLTFEPRQQVYFVAGVLLAAYAILSPLDELGERFSFAVHMVQHLLMLIPIPILLLLGTPSWLLQPFVRRRPVDYVMRVLTHPLVVTILFNLTFLGWHVPWLYEWTLVDQQVHVFEHITFMGVGLLSWWPVMGPSHQLQSPFLKVGYIFVQKLPSTVLGAVLVFAEAPLYAGYANQTVRLWGWTPLLDQQIGGVLMWVPPGIVYLVVLAFIFFSWMSDGEAEALPEGQGNFV